MRKLLLLAVLISLPLSAEQKNVKQLIGLSDFELGRAMNEIAAGLGVSCDFCHEHKEHDWNFASDAKKEKQKAREMIAMTRGLNEGSFGGRATISCYTCHRGKDHPTGLVPLPVPVPTFGEAEHHPAPTPGATPNPTAEELVKKYAAAVGDASRWSSARFRGTRESLDGKQSTPFSLEASNGSYHITVDTPGGKVEQAATATEGWVKGPEARVMAPAELARFQYQAASYEPVNPSSIPKEARVVGKEKVNDHEVWALFTVLGPKQRQRLYFDTTTGLLVRRVLLTESPVGTIPQQTDYDDWRDAGGAKYPFSVKSALIDPWSSAQRKYTEVAVGAKVDDKVFAK
jgi:hypothetical protein